MEQICVELNNSRLGVSEVLSILSLMKSDKVKVLLFDKNFKTQQNDKMFDENLLNFSNDFKDYYENNLTIIKNTSNNIKKYQSFNTEELIETCPQQIIFEIAQAWNEIQDGKQWNKQKEIWEYIVCPNFKLGDTLSNNKYGYPFQCGQCKICKIIEKVVEN